MRRDEPVGCYDLSGSNQTGNLRRLGFSRIGTRRRIILVSFCFLALAKFYDKADFDSILDSEHSLESGGTHVETCQKFTCKKPIQYRSGSSRQENLLRRRNFNFQHPARHVNSYR